MTRERTKELLPVIQAWAEGKDIQYKHPHGEWRTIIMEPGWQNDYKYRIKQTPTLRPWRPEEVPVGCQCRIINDAFAARELLVSVGPTGVYMGRGAKLKFTELLQQAEHSIDNGKTWLPCGVIEE